MGKPRLSSEARLHQPTPSRLGHRSGANSPPAMPTECTARLPARFAPPSLPLRSSFAFTPPRSGALAHVVRSGGVGWCRLASEGGELSSNREMEERGRSIPSEGGKCRSIPTRRISGEWGRRVVRNHLTSSLAVRQDSVWAVSYCTCGRRDFRPRLSSFYCRIQPCVQVDEPLMRGVNPLRSYAVEPRRYKERKKLQDR